MAPVKATKNLYKLIKGPVARDETGQVREVKYIVEVKAKKKPSCFCVRAKESETVLESAYRQMLADLPKDEGSNRLVHRRLVIERLF